MHVLVQPASNLIFGFDFSATAFIRSKDIAHPHHWWCRSQALEEGVRDCMLASIRRCTPLKKQSTPYRKVMNDAGFPLPQSWPVFSDTWDWSSSHVFCCHCIGKAVYFFLPLPLSKGKLTVLAAELKLIPKQDRDLGSWRAQVQLLFARQSPRWQLGSRIFPARKRARVSLPATRPLPLSQNHSGVWTFDSGKNSENRELKFTWISAT